MIGKSASRALKLTVRALKKVETIENPAVPRNTVRINSGQLEPTDNPYKKIVTGATMAARISIKPKLASSLPRYKNSGGTG